MVNRRLHFLVTGAENSFLLLFPKMTLPTFRPISEKKYSTPEKNYPKLVVEGFTCGC